MNLTIPGAVSQFSFAGTTGAIAAGAGSDSELLQFRWTNTSHLAVITEIRLTGMYATTAFAAGAITVKATIARVWTADGSGGTTIDIQGGDSNVNVLQLRTNMDDSLAGSMRIASTGALTAGTKSLDLYDIGQIATHSSGGVGSATPIIGNIYLPTTELFKADIKNGQYPIVLNSEEGIVVRATVPATGVWHAGIAIKWAEIGEYNL